MNFRASWSRVLAVAAAVGSLATGPVAAHATSLLQCQGTESVTYSPALTFVPKEITITTDGELGSCVDPAGQVTSGSYHERFTILAGCDDLLDGFQADRTFDWNTGDASVIHGSGTSTAVAGQVVTTITAAVVHGRFQGGTAVEVIPLPQPSALQCLTTGVTSAFGLTTLTVA